MQTRKEFIKKLQQLLLWKYNKSEIQSIVQDYEHYFSIGKEMGKTQERICAELGNPLAIVRELNIKKEDNRIINHINHKALIRTFFLTAWIVLFSAIIYYCSDGRLLRIRLIITNPVVILLGWFIIGGKEFTRAWASQVEDTYRAIKITILHSLFLMMAIQSFMLATETIRSWEAFSITKNLTIVNKEVLSIRCLSMFLVIAAIIMGFSIYQYRCYSIEYYSVICHGTGFIGMILSYMNVINHLQYKISVMELIFGCEGVYIQSLVLTSVFIIYCSKCRKTWHKKYSPY